MNLAADPIKVARMATLSFDKMRMFRRSRTMLLSEYVGRLYGKASSGEAKPLNLIHQATTTLVPNLVYNDPKSKISTNYMPFREYAAMLELAVNHGIEVINLRHTLRRIITDAIFLAGFVKSGITLKHQTLEIMGIQHDIGQIYADRVDPDDMIIDALARDWEEQKIIGNRYYVDKEALQMMPEIDPDQVEQLSRRTADTINTSLISHSQDAMELEMLSGQLELVDIWLPDENVLMTLPCEPGGDVIGKPIKVNDYEGPDKGPYNMLGFAFVPDNILPVAPATIWFDLHVMANKIARRAGRQADRNKRVLAYESSAWQDAQDLLDSMDGEAVKVDSVDGIKEIELGGVTDDTYTYINWAKEQFSEMAMNIDLLAGVGTNEPTATQAEIVQANTSIRLADLQHIVYRFTADIMDQIAFFLHTDPLIELPLIQRMEGLDTQVMYTPEMRKGDWIDYYLRVIPYSMARQDPNMKVRRIMEFTSNIIPALGQAAMMLGPAFNLEATINLLGREMGIEELDEIINSPALQQMMAKMQMAIDTQVPMPPKVMQNILGLEGQDMGMGAQLGQPNPMAGMQSGITPGQEMNARRQETAGELQAANQMGNSVNALAAAL